MMQKSIVLSAEESSIIYSQPPIPKYSFLCAWSMFAIIILKHAIFFMIVVDVFFQSVQHCGNLYIW